MRAGPARPGPCRRHRRPRAPADRKTPRPAARPARGPGRAGRARAGPVQPQQQRQAHIAVGEGHRHDQPGDHETVPAADPVAALRGPIMLPRRAEHAAPVAVEQGVIHRHGQRLALGGERGHHQPGQGQPQRVGVPAGVGEDRCARDQCARAAIPAAAHMPVTVRGSTAPNAPVTSNAKVRKVGAVNTARQAPSTSHRPAGTVADGSIDETTRPGCLITRRCFPHVRS